MVSGECRFLFQHLLYEFQTMNQFLGKLLGKFGPKKSNLFILPENWDTLHLKDADSYSEISFLNFKTINQFLGKFLCKFGPRKSNLFILPKNWHTLYLEDADSYPEISFLNFKTKIR